MTLLPLLAMGADAALAAPAGDTGTLRTESIAPGLFRLSTGDDSMLLRAGATGSIAVDTMSAVRYGELSAQIQRIAKQPAGAPVRAVVLTAVGPAQSGAVLPFANDGVPLVVQRKLLSRVTGGPSAPIAYDNDYMLRAGGVEAEVEHVGSGRTGTDSVVFFRDLRIVGVGALYTHAAPQPDCASGGSFAGWAAAISHLMWFDFDVAVPAQGAPVDKAELLAFRDRLLALAAQAGRSTPQAVGCGAPLP